MKDYHYYITKDAETLKKIFILRIVAWQTNGYLRMEDFPNGWKDSLDESAVVWATEVNKQIVASCRVNYFDKKETINYSRANQLCDYISELGIDIEFPLAYISRMVVNPAHRQNGISQRLDKIRMEHIRNYGAKTILATTDLTWRRDSLVNRDWVYHGKINPEFDPNSEKGQSYVISKKIIP